MDTILDQIPKIESSEEGPKQKLETSLSISEYLKQPKEKRAYWIRSQLKATLPDGDLKDAFINGNQEYAFRCFKRRSDGESANKYYPDSTYEQSLNNLHEKGIEAKNNYSVTQIQPATPFMTYFLPDESDFRDGVDISISTIYRNKPFVVNNPDDASEAFTFTPGDQQFTRIPISQAKDIPTLRDNMVGYLEVRWVKPGSKIQQLTSRLRRVVK